MLTHLDSQGRANMVDVTEKAVTEREATAEARVRMLPQTLQMIVDGEHPKGDVFAVARIAGIQAAKKTSDLIPLCHPLPLTRVTLDFSPGGRDAKGNHKGPIIFTVKLYFAITAGSVQLGVEGRLEADFKVIAARAWLKLDMIFIWSPRFAMDSISSIAGSISTESGL